MGREGGMGRGGVWERGGSCPSQAGHDSFFSPRAERNLHNKTCRYERPALVDLWTKLFSLLQPSLPPSPSHQRVCIVRIMQASWFVRRLMRSQLVWRMAVGTGPIYSCWGNRCLLCHVKSLYMLRHLTLEQPVIAIAYMCIPGSEM